MKPQSYQCPRPLCSSPQSAAAWLAATSEPVCGSFHLFLSHFHQIWKEHMQYKQMRSSIRLQNVTCFWGESPQESYQKNDMKADADLFCTSKKKESVLFICSSYIARRMGRGAFKASCVICDKKKRFFRKLYFILFCQMFYKLLASIRWHRCLAA